MGAVAALLLIPCLWQPYIIAGDLSSHLYNAWLAGQIEQGKTAGQGLSLAHPITNVLADWALQTLLYKVGPAAAERTVVGAAVEIFFWGAFVFTRRAGGQRPWVIMPSLAMITYGLIFHLGFLNFYISAGLSLWLLALMWRPRYPSLWIAVPCSMLAMLAHPLPLAWAVATLLYVHTLRRVQEAHRFIALIGGAGVLILMRALILASSPLSSSLDALVGLEGILGLIGAGQFWLYGAKYLIVIVGIMIVWVVLFLRRLDRESFLEDPLVHVWILSMLAYILMPTLIQFPQYRYPLEFMQYRISLFIAVLFCAMVAGGPHGRHLTLISCLVAATFFTLVYVDANSFNRVRVELTRQAETLPPGARVVFSLGDSASPRLNGLIHIGSTACIGHCWDYGNYEPPSGAFRVRVSGLSDVVASSNRTVAEIESGGHIVTAREAPVYSVCPSDADYSAFRLRRLEAGQKTCLVLLPATD